MLWNSVLGYIWLVMLVIIWISGKEWTALTVPIVVVIVYTAVPVCESLCFIVPL